MIDGLEPLQEPPGSARPGRLLDPDLETFIRALVQRNPGLLLLTSRQALPDLDGTASLSDQRDLAELPREAAIGLLRQFQVAGTEKDLADACERFGCHALSLTLVGPYLCDAHGGDIRFIDRIDLHRADTETRSDRHRTAWQVLAAYDDWLRPPARAAGWAGCTWRRLGGVLRARLDPAGAAADLARHQTLAVLRLTGLFDRPAAPGLLGVLRRRPVIRGLTEHLVSLDDTDWGQLLVRLTKARLIRLNTDAKGAHSLDAHPLVREYFAEQLRRHAPGACRTAHARLFEHLCSSTPYRPDGLEGLQPLYQAIRRGCLAGRQQEACEVYRDRILRGTGGGTGVLGVNYSMFRFGGIRADLSALAAFFDTPWERVSANLTDSDRAWLSHEAAFDLRARGRLREALAPMRDSSEIAVDLEEWSAAATRYANLSSLEVLLGELPDAVAHARTAVACAETSRDQFQRTARRATLANALHQCGERAEAGRLLRDAEQIQRNREPQCQLLYSLQGVHFCDWLLAPAERGAWRTLLANQGWRLGLTIAPQPAKPLATVAARPDGHPSTDLLAVCNEVEQRAQAALNIVLRGSKNLIDIALNHLTLARARLLRALLTGPLPPPGPDPQTIDAAVAGLCQAGRTDYLPRALLTAAWTQALRGDPDAARAALDEALQIAQRGPMPLFEAEVWLYRARLGVRASRPVVGQADSDPERGQDAPAPCLAQARRLIEHHGYRRRLPELEDAEAALIGP